MNRVSINHALDASSRNRLAMALLLVGLCTFVSSFIYLQKIATASELLKAQIEAQVLPKTTSTKPSDRALDASRHAELAAVNGAIEDIVLPWSALFRALEQANLEEVKLLAVDPKVQEHSIHITAITLSYENMRKYIKRLNEQGVLKLVNLASTQAVMVDGRTMMQFELKVSW